MFGCGSQSCCVFSSIGANCFGQVQIILSWLIFYNLDLSKTTWTQPKRIGPVQNNWYSTKIICSVKNNFGPIEGQGIRLLWKQHSVTISLFQPLTKLAIRIWFPLKKYFLKIIVSNKFFLFRTICFPIKNVLLRRENK